MTSILVVEDHPVFVQSLSRLLRERGSYEVMAAATGEQAFDLLDQSQVDLMLIDISLPGRSGLWLLKKVRERRPELPCVMLSGFATAQYVKQSMDEGARGYVLKDDVPGILEAIRAALDGKTFVSEAVKGK